MRLPNEYLQLMRDFIYNRINHRVHEFFCKLSVEHKNAIRRIAHRDGHLTILMPGSGSANSAPQLVTELRNIVADVAITFILIEPDERAYAVFDQLIRPRVLGNVTFHIFQTHIVDFFDVDEAFAESVKYNFNIIFCEHPPTSVQPINLTSMRYQLPQLFDHCVVDKELLILSAYYRMNEAGFIQSMTDVLCTAQTHWQSITVQPRSGPIKVLIDGFNYWSVVSVKPAGHNTQHFIDRVLKLDRIQWYYCAFAVLMAAYQLVHPLLFNEAFLPRFVSGLTQLVTTMALGRYDLQSSNERKFFLCGLCLNTSLMLFSFASAGNWPSLLSNSNVRLSH